MTKNQQHFGVLFAFAKDKCTVPGHMEAITFQIEVMLRLTKIPNEKNYIDEHRVIKWYNKKKRLTFEVL